MNDWLPPLNLQPCHIINEIEMKFHVKHKPKNNNKIFCCMLYVKKKESKRHHDDPVPKRNKCQLSWWFNIKCESFFLFFTSFFILWAFLEQFLTKIETCYCMQFDVQNLLIFLWLTSINAFFKHLQEKFKYFLTVNFHIITNR